MKVIYVMKVKFLESLPMWKMPIYYSWWKGAHH